MPKHSVWYKVIVFALLVVGFLPMLYFASIEIGIAEVEAEPTTSQNGVPAFDRYVENVAFGVGEHLSFDIDFGFINAGHATMQVQRLIEWEGRPAYQIVTTASSNRFFSAIYNVEDRAESIIDAVGVFSWRFEKKLQEGSYRSHRQYEFDQRSHTVDYNDSTYHVAPFVQDALSALYFTRTQALEIGKDVAVDNFIDGRINRLEIKVVKRETVKVDAGTFDCIVVEPMTESVGLFKHEGAIRVWLTDDYLKMPVIMQAKLPVGSISAKLTDYELGELQDF